MTNLMYDAILYTTKDGVRTRYGAVDSFMPGAIDAHLVSMDKEMLLFGAVRHIAKDEEHELNIAYYHNGAEICFVVGRR